MGNTASPLIYAPAWGGQRAGGSQLSDVGDYGSRGGDDVWGVEAGAAVGWGWSLQTKVCLWQPWCIQHAPFTTCGGRDLWGPGVLPSPVLTEYGPGPCTCSREYCRPYLGTECAELLSLNIRGL